MKTNRLTLLLRFALLATVDHVGDILEETSPRADIHRIGLGRSDCCRPWLCGGFDMAQVSWLAYATSSRTPTILTNRFLVCLLVAGDDRD
jgi:hypothetical protein